MLTWLKTHVFPVANHENPRWFYAFARGFLALFLVALPFVFDTSVPEVSGDMRWYFIRWSGLGLLILAFVALATKRPTLQFKLPIAGWLVAGLMAMAVISVVDTYSLPRSWWFLKHFLSYGLLFGLVYMLRHPQWYRTLVWCAVLPVFVIAPLTTAQFLGWSDALIHNTFPLWPEKGLLSFYLQSAPPGGTFANKNLAGSWLVTMLPLAFYLFISARRWWAKSIALGLATLAACALLYTRSRASWVALLITLVCVAGWVIANPAARAGVFHWVKRPLNSAVVAASLLFVVLASTLTGFNPTLGTSVLGKAATLADVDSHSISSRLSYNLNSLMILRDNPLNGTGIGSFHTVYPMYHSALRPTPEPGYSIKARPQRTHNDLMQAFVELGLLGGLLMTGCFVALVVMVLRLQGFSANTAQDKLPLFLGISLFTLCVNATGDFPFQMPTAPAVLFIFFAVLTGLTREKFGEAALHGPSRSFTPPKWGWFAAALATGVVMVLIIQGDMFRRSSAQNLKMAMARMQANVFDDTTKHYLDKAHTLYPLNNRLQEYRGVFYSNYAGEKQLSWETRIKVLEENLKYDPFAANTIINLGAMKFNQGLRALQLQDTERAKELGDELLALYEQLLPVAVHIPHPPALAGLGYMLKGDYNTAYKYFVESLKIDNSHPPAVWGYQKIREMAVQQQAASSGSK